MLLLAVVVVVMVVVVVLVVVAAVVPAVVAVVGAAHASKRIALCIFIVRTVWGDPCRNLERVGHKVGNGEGKGGGDLSLWKLLPNVRGYSGFCPQGKSVITQY